MYTYTYAVICNLWWKVGIGNFPRRYLLYQVKVPPTPQPTPPFQWCPEKFCKAKNPALQQLEKKSLCHRAAKTQLYYFKSFSHGTEKNALTQQLKTSTFPSFYCHFSFSSQSDVSSEVTRSGLCKFSWMFLDRVVLRDKHIKINISKHEEWKVWIYIYINISIQWSWTGPEENKKNLLESWGDSTGRTTVIITFVAIGCK